MGWNGLILGMQFNKMAKLKRLKGFSEFVKRLKHPRKNDSKKIRLKNRLDWNSKKRAKNYQNKNFFQNKKNFRTKEKFFELYEKIGKFSRKFKKNCEFEHFDQFRKRQSEHETHEIQMILKKLEAMEQMEDSEGMRYNIS